MRKYYFHAYLKAKDKLGCVRTGKDEFPRRVVEVEFSGFEKRLAIIQYLCLCEIILAEVHYLQESHH